MTRSLFAGQIPFPAVLRTLAASTLMAGVVAGQDAARTKTYADLGLKLTLPALEGLSESRTPGAAKAEFTGKLGALDVCIRLALITGGERVLAEPEDVAEIARDGLWQELANDETSKSSRLAFQPFEIVPGHFG